MLRIATAVAVFASLASAPLDGQSIVFQRDRRVAQGAIRGVLVQRGPAVADAESSIAVVYRFTPGEHVTRIDTTGVHVASGTALYVRAVRRHERVPDQLVLARAAEVLGRDRPSEPLIEQLPDGIEMFFSYDPMPTTQPPERYELIGTLRVADGRISLLPVVQIRTFQANLELYLSNLANFRR